MVLSSNQISVPGLTSIESKLSALQDLIFAFLPYKQLIPLPWYEWGMAFVALVRDNFERF